MDKLKMAHEWAMKIIEGNMRAADAIDLVDRAWRYVDLMQAEADKRNKVEAEQKRKEVREILNDANTFIEREGQHFDDVCIDEMYAQRDAELYGYGFLKVTQNENDFKYERLNPMTVSVCAKNIGLDSGVLKEWQPDWSQAPTNELEELNYWCMDENGDSWWFSVKPKAKYGQWNSKNETGLAIKAPSFNYDGTWKDSLRKRPSNI